MFVRRLIRDPLLHFLAAGGLLFAAYHLIHGSAPAVADDKTIVVDRAALLRFLQYQSNAFQSDYFTRQFDAMSPSEKQTLVHQYVREEALFREAKAMGLGKDDYVIRRRMVQKVLYLIDDTATESFSPSKADLARYFHAHEARYRIAPSLTFTHVFVDASKVHAHSAEETAEELKHTLQSKGARFQDAPSYGDRFPYRQNYVNTNPDYIRSQFGAAFTNALLKLTPSDHVWRGPIKSQFGYHLVMLTSFERARLPKLSEIKGQVKDDLLRDTISAYRDKALADLMRRFTVKLDGISAAPARVRTVRADRTSSSAGATGSPQAVATP